MGGRGPAPDPYRRRRNAPARGDWQEIPEKSGIKAPKLPARKPAWSAEAKRAWSAWWEDGAATTWGPAERVAVEQLLALVDAMARGELRHAPEVRLRMDALGLSPKGKRDLRLHVVPDEDSKPDRSQWGSMAKVRARERRSPDERHRLMAVDPIFDPRRLLEEG